MKKNNQSITVQFTNWVALLVINRFFIAFLLLYSGIVALLKILFQQSIADIFIVVVSFGIVLPLIGWLFFNTSTESLHQKPPQKREIIVLLMLALWITWYIAYGTSWINQLVPERILSAASTKSLFITVKKLLVFVAIPFLLYKCYGFTVADFGFKPGKKSFLNSRHLTGLIVLCMLAVVFQFTFSQGGNALHKHTFTSFQLWVGIPLCLLWLMIEAGLVEEFFFRAILQSRLSALVKSSIGGIIISGLIFGLVHAPGLYLRGASSENVTEQMPFGFWALYCVAYMSLAGIFLGVVWDKTRNIYFVILLHAAIDFIPNFQEFIMTWHL